METILIKEKMNSVYPFPSDDSAHGRSRRKHPLTGKKYPHTAKSKKFGGLL
jgi:hypothetical protein